MLRKQFHEENRVAWNAATIAHNSHKIDQAKFLREGGSTLFPEELELLGDIAGQTLVHLQCNAGQDTLSLAQRGAIVTGVDISDEAIEFARHLSTDANIPATFIRSDIYDWFEKAKAEHQLFDIVFSSYGALAWLSDIAAWGHGVASVLKPGGRFTLVEFHPFTMIFDWDWNLATPYFGEGKVFSYESGVGDYVAMSGEALAPMGFVEGVQDFQNPNPSHEFQWPVSEVASALTNAGLAITALREYPYSNGAKLFNDMRELPGQRMYPPERLPSLPLMYGLVARKI